LKTAIKTKTPEVKSKANVILILSMLLNQQSSKYFLRKMHSKLMWHLRFLNLYTENATGQFNRLSGEWVERGCVG
jgi:hypothetical protein